MLDVPRRAVVLVVEDEPFVRMVAVDVLREHGMLVLEADCAAEALEILETEGRIDLLFTDIDMPGDLDGLDLAAMAHRQRPELKLLVTSGAKMMADAEMPDHAVFLSKPYATRTLTQFVDSKLGSHD